MRNAGMTSDTQVEIVENGQVGVVETEEDGFGPCAARELAGGAKTDLLQVTRTGKLQNFRRPQQPLSNGKIVLFGVLHYSTADAVLAAPAGSAASQRHTCSHAEKAARTPQTPFETEQLSATIALRLWGEHPLQLGAHNSSRFQRKVDGLTL